MVYVTKLLSPQYHQMTFEEFLFNDNPKNGYVRKNETSTRTYVVAYHATNRAYIHSLIEKLRDFNTRSDVVELRNAERHSLYNTFHIPKKSGGLRKIDAPCEKLMNALRDLKTIFEDDFGALYHTSAYAYIRGRSTIKCIKKHQDNNSRWFEKLDLHNFFGSTTLEWTMKMLGMVYPFSDVIADPAGNKLLEMAIELAFLDGGLPQGTPISPIITNIVMIPIDHTIANTLRNFKTKDDDSFGQHFVYTRYADDFQISSRYDFDKDAVQKIVTTTLDNFNAPFKLNTTKTRYGSSSGRNWNLGIMLNSNNDMTIGSKKKRQFEAMISNYIMDKQHGKSWSLNDVQVLDGYRNYTR